MKIFKIAINNTIKQQVLDSSDGLPFDNVFENKMRIVIPIIQSPKLKHIINSLESGSTRTKTKYKVDLNNKIAYRLLQKDGELVVDPRPMRMGKIIQKELGQRWADFWSIESSSEDSESKSIILSRSPVDVVRMSDHETWTSCHSPDGAYFDSAIDEATSGGAVAYVVDDTDLQQFQKSGRSLQEEDIFKDEDRRIDGIVPISRTRVTRYINEEGEELGLPVTHTYGDSISGFVDTLTTWLKDKQSENFDYDEIDLHEFKRTGGQYADASDRSLIMNFFDEDKGIKTDLPHVGGTGRLAIWSEEIELMNESINEDLQYCSVHGEVDAYDGEDIFVYGTGKVNFSIRGYIRDEDMGWVNKNLGSYSSELSKGLKLKGWCGVISEVYIENNNGIVEITFDMNIEDINTPDDFEKNAKSYIDYERSDYHEDLMYINKVLIKNNILRTVKDSYLGNLNDDFDFEEIEDIDIRFNTNIKFNQSLRNDSYEIQKLREHIEDTFKNSLKEHMQNLYSGKGNQFVFNFYNHINNFQHPASMDVSSVTPIFSVMIPDYDFANFVISIPPTEVYRLGERYIESIKESYDLIYRDIHSAIVKFIKDYNNRELQKYKNQSNGSSE